MSWSSRRTGGPPDNFGSVFRKEFRGGWDELIGDRPQALAADLDKLADLIVEAIATVFSEPGAKSRVMRRVRLAVDNVIMKHAVEANTDSKRRMRRLALAFVKGAISVLA